MEKNKYVRKSFYVFFAKKELKNEFTLGVFQLLIFSVSWWTYSTVSGARTLVAPSNGDSGETLITLVVW